MELTLINWKYRPFHAKLGPVSFVFDQAHYHLTEEEVREYTIHPMDHQAVVVFLTKTHADSVAWKGLTVLKKREGSQGEKEKI